MLDSVHYNCSVTKTTINMNIQSYSDTFREFLQENIWEWSGIIFMQNMRVCSKEREVIQSSYQLGSIDLLSQSINLKLMFKEFLAAEVKICEFQKTFHPVCLHCSFFKRRQSKSLIEIVLSVWLFVRLQNEMDTKFKTTLHHRAVAYRTTFCRSCSPLLYIVMSFINVLCCW